MARSADAACWFVAPVGAALLAIGMTACRAEPVPVVLTEQDRVLAATAGLQEALLLEIKKAGTGLRQLEGTDADGKRAKAAGVTIGVPNADASATVRRLQDAMPPGHFVFVSERHFGIQGQPDEVSVMKAADPYAILRTMGTNGWNFDLSPEAVIARLKEWDASYGLVFRGIAFDWVEAEFKKQPEDMLGFAQEVYKFCPDVVDQGTETVPALAAEMKRTNTLYLWWD